MGNIYSPKPAPANHRSSNSPFDCSTATGGTHTGALNIRQMKWHRKKWTKTAEYAGEKRKKVSFLSRLFGNSSVPQPAPVPSHLVPRELGTAGNLHGAIWKFGYGSVVAGEEGEKITQQMLQNLLVIPGTRIFHGMKFPGSNTADVDHIVVNGNKMVIIDTKNWKSGDYWWEDANTVRRYSQGKTTDFTNHMPHVLEHYSTLFKGCEIRSRILVHCPSDKRQLFRNTYFVGRYRRFAPVPLVTPREFFQEIGDWFAADADGWINEDVLNQLLADLKTTPTKAGKGHQSADSDSQEPG